jgi:type I restriction enzyme S subunit
MKEWKEYKLSEFIQFGNGKERPKTEGNIPVFGGNGILGYCDKSNYEGETIIIGRVGAYCGSVYYQAKPIWVSDNALAAKPKHNNNTKFLYYFLKNLDLNSFAEGSSHPLITQTLLNSLDIYITDDIETQAAIAEVLSSLDDKIDLLHRQNKTLEQLAETLFRQWFVEEAEESWEVDTLGNLFDIKIGRTPPRKEQQWFSTNSTDVKWISIKDLGNSGIYIDTVSEYLTKEAIKKFSIPIIPSNTVLLSFKLTVGRVAITTEEMLSNEAIAHFKIRPNSTLYSEFLYLFLKAFNFNSLGSTSSIAEAINSQMIKEIEMQIPSEGKLESFRMEIEPLFQKIKSNTQQIRTLTQLRDTLLPKLMSGEVRVAH